MPWICDRCGGIADGDMCMGCGVSRRHEPVVYDKNMTAYTGITPMGASGKGGLHRFWKWTPVTWFTLAIVLAGFLAILFAALR